MTSPIEVESYAGCKADEEPRAFTVEGARRAVLAVVDRWYDPDGDYFKVRADDGQDYLLRHEHANDEWFVVAVSPPHA